MKTLLGLSCILFGTGCMTGLGWNLHDFQHPDPSEKSIILDKSQTRDCWVSNTATLPQGVYKPELTIEKGIFYRAPIPILIEALGLIGPQYGGIYIPNEKDENQQHGVYILPATHAQLGIMRLRPNNLKFRYAD